MNDAGGATPRASIGSLAGALLTLGSIAFGGPAAHIALMRAEFVARRGWLTDSAYLDLVSAANLIPGPNSTEVAMHVGYRRAGWWGLLVAGACFIAPAFVVVLAFAWTYRRFAATPSMEWLLYGVQPMIVAAIVQAFLAMVKSARRGPLFGAIGLAVLAGYVAGVHELLLLSQPGGAARHALTRSEANSASTSDTRAFR